MLNDDYKPTFDAKAAARAVYDSEVPRDQTIPLEIPDEFTQDWIDDTVLRAHMATPIWSESTLVERKPNIWQIGYALGHRVIPKVVLVADDSLVIGDGDRLETLVSISTVPVDGRILYQMTLQCLSMTVETLIQARAFQALAHRLGIVSFADAALMDRFKLRINGQGFVDYIASAERQRPVFIFPRASKVSKKVRHFHDIAISMMSPFGAVVRNDELYQRYDHLFDGDKYLFVADLPDGEAMTLGKFGLEGAHQIFFMLERCQSLGDISDAECSHRAGSSAFAMRKPPKPVLEPQPKLVERTKLFKTFWTRLLDRARELREEQRKLALRDAEPEQAPAIAKPAAPREIKVDENGYPLLTGDVVEWAERKFGSKVTFLSRAKKAMSKTRHPDPARIAAAIEALAGPKFASLSGDRDAVEAFDEALLALRMRDGFSNAERLKGQTGDAYVVHHAGRKMLLERHLCSISSGFNDPKMIRIYYAYDREAETIVIGWLPSHLPNSQS